MERVCDKSEFKRPIRIPNIRRTVPIVTGLNCEIPIQLPRADDNILDPSSLTEAIYPVKIAFYNIGTGMAEN